MIGAPNKAQVEAAYQLLRREGIDRVGDLSVSSLADAAAGSPAHERTRYSDAEVRFAWHLLVLRAEQVETDRALATWRRAREIGGIGAPEGGVAEEDQPHPFEVNDDSDECTVCGWDNDHPVHRAHAETGLVRDLPPDAPLRVWDVGDVIEDEDGTMRPGIAILGGVDQVQGAGGLLYRRVRLVPVCDVETCDRDAWTAPDGRLMRLCEGHHEDAADAEPVRS